MPPDVPKTSESPAEAAFREAAQIAFDQQSDNPTSGDWNAACLHIVQKLAEARHTILTAEE